MTPRTPARSRPGRSTTRWLVGGNAALLAVAGVLLALLLAHPPTQPEADTANALGAQALDRVEDYPADAPPGSMASLRDVTWFIPSTADARYDMPRGYDYGCEQNQQDSEARRCDFGDQDGDVTVAMVGDSKILQWQSAVATLAHENSWHVLSYTKSNCGLHAGLQTNHGQPYHSCQEWNEQVMTDLLDDPPDVVLLSSYMNTALDPPTEQQESEAAMTDALAAQWRLLVQAGIAVVVILDNPNPDGDSVYECAAAHLQELAACAFDRAEGIARSGQPVQLAAAELVPQVHTVDLTDDICPEEMCVPVIGNVLIYRQGSHLTDVYIRTLTPALGRELVPIITGLTGQDHSGHG